MWKLFSRIFLMLFLVLSLCALGLPERAAASTKDWHRGASIMSHGQKDFGSASFRQSVAELKKLNPTHVTLIITLYQKDTRSTELYAGADTPTDEALISAIDYIHSLGLKTHLKFHIETDDRKWRAYINPEEDVRAAWFASYTAQLQKYGRIAERHNVDMITLGTELTNMTSDDVHPKNTERWKKLIKDMRSVYSRKLTYCANSSSGLSNWENEKGHIKFWGDLDYIGISSYHGMTTSKPTVESFIGKWTTLNNNDFKALHKKYNKPLLFDEIGYRNVDFAHTRLYDFWSEGPSNEQRQADLYQAMFTFWNNIDYMAGVNLWNWSSDPTVGGPTNIDYTPRGKKAEAIIATWWGGTVSAMPTKNPQLITRARISPSSIESGQEGKVIVTIENKGAETINDAIVDIEIYTHDGQKIFQSFFEHKQLPQNGSKTYTAIWTAGEPGKYSIRVGIFTADWSKIYAWNEKAGSIAVKAPLSDVPENPVATDMHIWWPNDGAVVGGTQPFKAQISNLALSQYTMFWRVDGGTWNMMYDTTTDGPHKEAIVDVGSWKWNDLAPYTVEFMAKNTSGNVIAEKRAQISVVH